MKKLFKTVILCLCFALVFTAAACGGNNNDSGSSSGGSSSGDSSGSSGSQTIVFYLSEKVEVKEYSSVELEYTVSGISAADIVWKTNNSEIATVSAGVVVGVKAGVTTITATAGDVVRECEVTVIKNSSYPVLVLSQEDCMPRVGGSVKVTAGIRFNGEIQDFANFNWKSLNEEIATVSGGEITGVSKGETIVTVSATYNGIYLEEQVKVVVAAE